MPVYNGEKFIKQNIINIMNQSFRDFELIVINDGSTDCTQNICESLSKIDNRIIFITKENGGPSEARNLGIKMAKGTWICFIDSDDYVDTTYLSSLISQYDNNADLIMSTFLYGERHVDILPSSYQYRHLYKLGNIYNDIHIHYLGYIFGKLFKCDIIKEHKIQFTSNIKIAEDSIFISQYLYYTTNVFIVDSDQYHYKTNIQNSLSKTANINERFVSYKYNLEERKKLVDKLHIESYKIYYYYINSLNYAIKCMYKNCIIDKKERIEYLKKFAGDDYFRYLRKSNSRFNKMSYYILKLKFYRFYDLLNMIFYNHLWRR